jgi:hypothetical protein
MLIRKVLEVRVLVSKNKQLVSRFIMMVEVMSILNKYIVGAKFLLRKHLMMARIVMLLAL